MRRPRTGLVAFTVTLALSVATATSQQTTPPRDAPAAAQGSGVIRGRVVAAATGRPLHRVRVSVNTQRPNPPSAVTDTRGIFEIAEVPAGSYSLTATRAGYLTIQYGQRRPREAGRTIEVRAGEAAEGIDIALFRGGVLAGRISDEAGDPSSGARVEAIELRYVRGRRVPVAARITTTNDAGEFRLSGLEPGVYQIRASTTEVWEGDDGKDTFVHAITWFPGVKEGEQPQNLNVAIGQEVAGLEFRLIAGRAARITGVVEDTNGTPAARQVVYLDRIMRTTGGALLGAGFGGRATTDERGAFELSKLAAGEYMVYTGADSQRVGVPAIVNDGELKHVVLTPRRQAALGGTIVTDEGTTPPFSAARVQVIPIAADAEHVLPMWASPRAQTPKANWSFRFGDMDGHYLFRVSALPDDWMLGSVLLGGRDTTDTPLSVMRGGPDVEGLQIVLSRKAGKVTGEVSDRSGTPTADATVVVFAENRGLWGLASRFIKAVRPDDRGRFSIFGLPPGTYRAAARELVIDGQWEDPAFLDSIVRDAVRIELGAGTTTTVRLSLGAAQ